MNFLIALSLITLKLYTAERAWHNWTDIKKALPLNAFTDQNYHDAPHPHWHSSKRTSQNFAPPSAPPNEYQKSWADILKAPHPTKSVKPEVHPPLSFNEASRKKPNPQSISSTVQRQKAPSQTRPNPVAIPNEALVCIGSQTQNFYFKPLPNTYKHLQSPELISLIRHLARSTQALFCPQNHLHHILSGITHLWMNENHIHEDNRLILAHKGSYATLIVFLLRMIQDPTCVDQNLIDSGDVFRIIRFYTLARQPAIDECLLKLNIPRCVANDSHTQGILRMANTPTHQADCARRVTQSMTVLHFDCLRCKRDTYTVPFPYQIAHNATISKHLEETLDTFCNLIQSLSPILHNIVHTMYRRIYEALPVNRTQKCINTDPLLSVFVFEALLNTINNGVYLDSFTVAQPSATIKVYLSFDQQRTKDLLMLFTKNLSPHLLHSMQKTHLDSALGFSVFYVKGSHTLPTNNLKSAIHASSFFSFLYKLLPYTSNEPSIQSMRYRPQTLTQPYAQMLRTLENYHCPQDLYHKAYILSELCTKNPYGPYVYVALSHLERCIQCRTPEYQVWFRRASTLPPATLVSELVEHALQYKCANDIFQKPAFKIIFKSDISQDSGDPHSFAHFLHIFYSQELFWDTLTADYELKNQEKRTYDSRTSYR